MYMKNYFYNLELNDKLQCCKLNKCKVLREK